MDTNVAVNLIVQGIMYITADSVNTIGVLKINDDPLAGDIEIFGEKVRNLADGSIEAVKVVTEELVIARDKVTNQSPAGQASIPAGQSYAIISNEYVDEKSLILLTPRTKSVGN